MKLYHVTRRTNLHSILENGLIPQIGDYSKEINEETTAVWLSPSLSEAKEMALVWLERFYGPDLVILEIELPDGYPLGYANDYEIFTVKKIPPEWIKVVDESSVKIYTSTEAEEALDHIVLASDEKDREVKYIKPDIKNNKVIMKVVYLDGMDDISPPYGDTGVPKKEIYLSLPYTYERDDDDMGYNIYLGYWATEQYLHLTDEQYFEIAEDVEIELLKREDN